MTRRGKYVCTEKTCSRAALEPTDHGLNCPNGHFFAYVPRTTVPVFAKRPPGSNEYSREDAAAIHDNAFRWVFNTFFTSEDDLRRSLIARLNLSAGDRVLVTGAGAGNDIPYLMDALEADGEIYAQDFAQEMLLTGVERHGALAGEAGISLHFSVSDATNLPLEDDYFDAAYHFGGINLFSDIAEGISEMNRVTKSGGTVVISDEGMAPWLRNTELGAMLVQNNSLYACEAPLEYLPETADSVTLTWELSNCFYVISFVVTNRLPPVDLDVKHLGLRGGSIRSRYAGQLEGVDPALRDRLNAEAARQGISRVEFLEEIIRGRLEGRD